MGELVSLTSDLPAAAQAKEVMRIDQRFGSVARTGRWAVPRRMEMVPHFCHVTLDFTEAVLAYDTLRIDMDMQGRKLVLVTKPGIVLDTGRVTIPARRSWSALNWSARSAMAAWWNGSLHPTTLKPYWSSTGFHTVAQSCNRGRLGRVHRAVITPWERAIRHSSSAWGFAGNERGRGNDRALLRLASILELMVFGLAGSGAILVAVPARAQRFLADVFPGVHMPILPVQAQKHSRPRDGTYVERLRRLPRGQRPAPRPGHAGAGSRSRPRCAAARALPTLVSAADVSRRPSRKEPVKDRWLGNDQARHRDWTHQHRTLEALAAHGRCVRMRRGTVQRKIG
jgi:hypothetical protein